LKSRISESGHFPEKTSFVTEIPFADLIVRINEKFVGVLNTDDDLFRRAITVKDPFVYTPLVLKDKNWEYKMFFSRRFWHDPENELEDMDRFLTKCKERVIQD
jgi:hypothetical protein